MKKIIAVISAICIMLGAFSMTAMAQNAVTVNVCVYEYVNKKYIVRPTNVTSDKIDNAYDALQSLDGLQIASDGNGYVHKINEFVELEHGKQSGWIYKVNGTMPSVSPSAYKVKDGDVIQWIYVTSSAQSQMTINDDGNSVNATEMTTHLQSATTAFATDITGSQTGSTSQTASDTTAVSNASTKVKTNAVETTAAPISKDTDAAIRQSLKYLKQNPGNYTPLVLSLYTQSVSSDLKDTLVKQAASASLKPTDMERLIIQLSAVGIAPENINGVNLTNAVFNNDNLLSQGLNGIVFALFAVPHCKLDGTEKHNAENLTDIILQNQKVDGSFSLTYDMDSDVDLTAMAVTALAPYNSRADVSSSIDRALVWLSANQNNDGSYSSMGTASAESTAQVIIAVSTLGIKIGDSRFVKDANMIDALMSFSTDDGFSHIADGNTDIIATEQALLAIAAYNQGKNPYTIIIENHVESINFTWIIVSAVAVALIAAAAVFVIKKRSSNNKGAKND